MYRTKFHIIQIKDKNQATACCAAFLVNRKEETNREECTVRMDQTRDMARGITAFFYGLVNKKSRKKEKLKKKDKKHLN